MSVQLTKRQHEVLRLLAAGEKPREIAITLGVSITTVRDHIRFLLAKFRARNQPEAILHAFREGVLKKED